MVLKLPAQNFGLSISRNDFVLGEPVTGVRFLDEYHFFQAQDTGQDLSGCLPIHSGVTHWYNALYKDSAVLFASNKRGDVYIIADDPRTGTTLYHYESANPNDDVLRYSSVLPRRSITNRKEQTSMNALGSLAAQSGNARQGMSRPMNLEQGAAPAAPAAYGAMDGIGNAKGDKFSIQAMAQTRGYVFGYIVRNAPSTSAKLKPIRDKNKNVTGHEIQFVQTKPSGLLSVLIAVPSCCVMHNGNVASPTSILAGDVDFNTIDPNEMTFLEVNERVAISLIQAFGGRLPEYRPNVIPGQKTQWTGEEIQNSPDVSFVVPRTSKSQSKKSTEAFIVHLKSTRGMLFTQDNVMCLRALEHLPCPMARGNSSDKFGTANDQEEFLLNESAFGMWRFRRVKENNQMTDKTMAQVALAECPNDIWEKTYTGVRTSRDKTETPQDVEGFGSRMFAQVGTAGQEHGFNNQTVFYPWYVNPKDKEKKSEPVSAIAFRRVVATKDGNSKRASTEPVLWRDNENHAMFRPYAAFANAVISSGFLSREKLRGMGTRAARKGSGSKKVDPAVEAFLTAYLDDQETQAAFENVQREYANNRYATASR